MEGLRNDRSPLTLKISFSLAPGTSFRKRKEGKKDQDKGSKEKSLVLYFVFVRKRRVEEKKNYYSKYSINIYIKGKLRLETQPPRIMTRKKRVEKENRKGKGRRETEGERNWKQNAPQDPSQVRVERFELKENGKMSTKGAGVIPKPTGKTSPGYPLHFHSSSFLFG